MHTVSVCKYLEFNFRKMQHLNGVVDVMYLPLVDTTGTIAWYNSLSKLHSRDSPPETLALTFTLTQTQSYYLS